MKLKQSIQIINYFFNKNYLIKNIEIFLLCLHSAYVNGFS